MRVIAVQASMQDVFDKFYKDFKGGNFVSES